MKKKDPCINCEWNTDLGCSCRKDERIYQCYLYRINHPAEVIQFDKGESKKMKKYTLEIYFKQDNELFKSYKTNNLSYIRKILINFYYTSLGTPTTALLDYKHIIIHNESGKHFTNFFPSRIECAYNKIIDASPDIDR